MKTRTRTPSLRVRLWVMLGLMSLMATSLAVRAVELQVVRKDFYQRQGDARHVRVAEIPASRGMVVDRHGEPLAVSTPVDSASADPRTLLLQARARIPDIAQVLGLDAEALEQALMRRADKEFMWLRRHLHPEVANQVRALGVPGVSLQREYRRYYPAGEVFAHVVGFTDIDDRGQEGLELSYDSSMAGRPGAKRVIRDRMGRTIEDVEMIRAAEPGRVLTLSLDRRIQYLAYRELKATMAEVSASSGSIVVLDARTGEVLAMVNQPSFNPNARDRRQVSASRNRAVTDVFEPGSIIKPFTVAAALESGRFRSDTVFHTAPGSMLVGRHPVRDVRNFGDLDMAGLLRKSSNVAAAQLALGMPADHLWDAFRRFGFGQVSGSGFPGESPGLLPDWQRWRELEKATLSYGYGLTTTPLQMAVAYAALANGGRLRAPTFLRVEPNPDQAVIDPMLASQVLGMLESVVGPEGTGLRAQVHHYRVGGKTGTSRKVGAGGYENRYVAAFAGIAPISQPRLVAVVVVHEPKGAAYYGGQIAAPLFGRVVGGALRLLDVPPDAINVQQALVADLEGAELQDPLELAEPISP